MENPWGFCSFPQQLLEQIITIQVGFPVKVHWVAGIIHCRPRVLSYCDRKSDVSMYCGNFNKPSQYAPKEHILQLKYITVNNRLS